MKNINTPIQLPNIETAVMNKAIPKNINPEIFDFLRVDVMNLCASLYK